MPESPILRLRALAERPAEQFALAVQIVERERNPDAVIAALAVLERTGDERARPALLARYAQLAADGARRAAALVVLGEVDPTLAGFHATRLLHDSHTSPMSGEPAVTAARVLADVGQPLPLYDCALRP